MQDPSATSNRIDQDRFRPIEANDIVDGEDYFIALRPTLSRPEFLIQSRDENGHIVWSRNLAKKMKFNGCKGLRLALAKNTSIVAVSVQHEH